jgi:hypothetical protein
LSFEALGSYRYRFNARPQSSAYAAGLEIMLKDELEVFGRNVQELAMHVSENILRDGQAPVGLAPIKIFSLFRGTRTEAKILCEYGERLLADKELGPLIRYLSVNIVTAGARPAVNIMREFGGVLEISFSNMEDANRIFIVASYGRIAGRLSHSTSGIDALVIPTRENLFLDKTQNIDCGNCLVNSYLSSPH